VKKYFLKEIGSEDPIADVGGGNGFVTNFFSR
jgi:hypothetical protein